MESAVRGRYLFWPLCSIARVAGLAAVAALAAVGVSALSAKKREDAGG